MIAELLGMGIWSKLGQILAVVCILLLGTVGTQHYIIKSRNAEILELKTNLEICHDGLNFIAGVEKGYANQHNFLKKHGEVINSLCKAILLKEEVTDEDVINLFKDTRK